jgi:DNA-binding CsgD family transcriptional regulator
VNGSDGLGRRVIDFMGQIGACRTQSELEAAASAECARVGITALASGMVTGPKSTSGDPFHFTTWPASWMDLYRERNWVEQDPVPRYAVVSGLPITWSGLMRDLPPSDAGHVIYRAARQHGFNEGYVTPVRTGDGHLGLVSVATDRTSLPPTHCHFLQAVCIATLHRAEAIRAEADLITPRLDSPPSFSARERQCLALLVQGHTDKEIAALLGISESTARFHVDNARIKAGARSRVHLAGTAAQWIGAPPRRPSGPDAGGTLTA